MRCCVRTSSAASRSLGRRARPGCRRCELVFDPFDLTRIEVRYQDRPLGLAVPVRIGRHTHPHANTESQPPSAQTGIDYLGLIAAQRDRELAARPIDYADLAEREHMDQSTEPDEGENDGSRG